ncbi:box C/D snoRNA protein 1 isoform X2 [Venturia canescens]|uniref:box C/D snoRNA protein 1 isoform X2 n=1 Tax=Venturia canescens TaxID=32260 RepID=UPI001C9CD552|nr:box C/D snoRNA protein 1-like isoform X2 [Venturia canescens]
MLLQRKKDKKYRTLSLYKGRLEECEVCAAQKAKYTCPKCEVRTCSLTCVNIHKKELKCDGIRDKTKFIPLNNFSDLDLLSDYRLLEEVGRSVDQLQRDPSKKCTRTNNLSVPLQKLRGAAHRSGVRLEFMPQNFSRHKDNTTFFNWKTNELFWRIEWIFPQAENAKWITKRVHESTRLSDVIQTILDPVNSDHESFKDEDLNTREILQNRLQFYRAAELTGIKVLMKAEKVKKSGSRFYELDLTLSLKENFAKKTIIEFPVIHVILKDHFDMYEIIDSDEEETMPEERFRNGDRRKRRENHMNRREKQSVKKEPLNYFFNGECTDSEDEESKDRKLVKSKFPETGIPQYDELVRMEL